MDEILGLVMFYAWAHALVIIFKNLKVQGYDKAVCIAAFVFIILFVRGALM